MKKTVYINDESLKYFNDHRFGQESLGQFINRLVSEHRNLNQQSDQVKDLLKQMKSIRFVNEQVFGNTHIILELLNTWLKGEDYGRLWTLEEHPADIMKQALNQEREWKRKGWLETHKP